MAAHLIWALVQTGSSGGKRRGSVARRKGLSSCLRLRPLSDVMSFTIQGTSSWWKHRCGGSQRGLSLEAMEIALDIIRSGHSNSDPVPRAADDHLSTPTPTTWSRATHSPLCPRPHNRIEVKELTSEQAHTTTSWEDPDAPRLFQGQAAPKALLAKVLAPIPPPPEPSKASRNTFCASASVG